MVYLRRNKGGVSPLIATVLIIGAVIVIATLLFVFMRDTLIKQIQKAGAGNEGGKKCMAIEPKISKCTIDKTKVTAKVKNDGTESIVQWIIRASGKDKKSGKDKIESINRAGEVKPKKERTIGGTFKNLQKITSGSEVEFVPVVSAKGIGFYCNDKIMKATCK